MAALEHGFNVIIDKPTLTLEEAKNWKKKLRNGTNFMFDAHLPAYPMVKQVQQ
jgi:predicted dehydrogenase